VFDSPIIPSTTEAPLLQQATQGSLGFGDLAVKPPEGVESVPATALGLFHDYLAVFIVAFLITLCVTPFLRKLAIAHGVVDRPLEARKAHRVPVAYLGGVGVFLGIMGGIAFSFLGFGGELPESIFRIHESKGNLTGVPFSILLGIMVITVIGLVDDVKGLDPRLKISGQLLAAAALALDEVGTNVAAGILKPVGNLLGNQDLTYHIALPFDLPLATPTNIITIDIIYWAGVAIIALFVLGATNASNLIDGLDGLLSGVTAIAAAGLLILALLLATHDDGKLDSARIILCLALLGGCMGFLPHNFNPATIFLGDCGSLLLGYLTIVIVLSLGDTGKSALVVAGLTIYAIPIIDTILAIVRRKMAGKPMSAPDDQHLHHMLKRALGVKGAVLTLYLIGVIFAGLGVWLSMGRVRVVFTIAMVVAAYIGVTAVKIARRHAIEAQALAVGGGTPPPTPPSSRAPDAKIPAEHGEPTPA